MTTLAESRTVLHWLAAGFGSGWLPKAPGTWGSLAALPPAWFILTATGVTGLMLAGLLVLILGCLVCARVLPTLADKDPGWIVIDEWAGLWICLALIAPLLGSTWLACLAAFIAFRLFDILKPWPISRVEKLGPPWWSIMADDVVAGIIGAGVVALLLMFTGAAL